MLLMSANSGHTEEAMSLNESHSPVWSAKVGMVDLMNVPIMSQHSGSSNFGGSRKREGMSAMFESEGT